MGCIVNNYFKVLYGHLKLFSVCSRFFGLWDTFEVLASGMPVLPATQTALLLRGAAAVSQILQASCLGISSVLACACLLKLNSLVLFGACWKNFSNILSNISTACLCSTQLINSPFWGGWECGDEYLILHLLTSSFSPGKLFKKRLKRTLKGKGVIWFVYLIKSILSHRSYQKQLRLICQGS